MAGIRAIKEDERAIKEDKHAINRHKDAINEGNRTIKGSDCVITRKFNEGLHNYPFSRTKASNVYEKCN